MPLHSLVVHIRATKCPCAAQVLAHHARLQCPAQLRHQREQLAFGRVRKFGVGTGPITRQLYRLRLPHRPVSHRALAFESLLAAPSGNAGSADSAHS